MINPNPPTDTGLRPRFTPRILNGGLLLDLERLAATMAVLEDYVDTLIALGEPLLSTTRIGEEELQLRVASL